MDWLDGLTGHRGANQTVDQPLSRKTRQNIHALLNAAFVTAMDSETMTRNPAKGVAGAGLRYSEATALRRRDITLKDGRGFSARESGVEVKR